jgi:hypothetical protein
MNQPSYGRQMVRAVFDGQSNLNVAYCNDFAIAGRFWPGFTKIGMVSANMSERMGSLEKVQNQQAWRLELDIHLSVVSNSLMAWVSYEHQV